jgi:hypothetical protein
MFTKSIARQLLSRLLSEDVTLTPEEMSTVKELLGAWGEYFEGDAAVLSKHLASGFLTSEDAEMVRNLISYMIDEMGGDMEVNPEMGGPEDQYSPGLLSLMKKVGAQRPGHKRPRLIVDPDSGVPGYDPSSGTFPGGYDRSKRLSNWKGRHDPRAGH